MAKSNSASPIKIPSAKNEDQPASRKMVRLVRDELKSDIRALSLKMDARFKQVDHRFDQMEVRFEARFEEMRAESFQTRILLEEQHANNRIVLEGLQALWQRQDRIEKRLA